MMRRLFLCLLLLAVGCRAQSPVNNDLQLRVQKQLRSTYGLPPYVSITVADRKPSTEFVGYDELTVRLSVEGQQQTRLLLLSKDSKTLVSVVKMDLTRDPQAEMMAKIDIKGRPARGAKSPLITVVVYDDFQCPYCSRMHQTINDVMKSYGDRVKVIYKDFPLVEIHPWAERAAIDSECLAHLSEGAYWDFADYVHANPQQIKGDQRSIPLQQAEVDRIALDTGKRHSVDVTALNACISAQSKTELEASMKEAEGIGVQATPAVIVNGMKMDGAIPEEEFRAILDRELQALGAADATKAESSAK